MELVGASVQVEAVSPVNGPNAITVVGGLGTEVATVSTRIISGFFDDTATYNNVLVTGIATVGFSENRRTLVRTRSMITKDIETQRRELEDEESEALGLFSLNLNLGEDELAPDSSSMPTTLANVFMSIVALGISCILNQRTDKNISFVILPAVIKLATEFGITRLSSDIEENNSDE